MEIVWLILALTLSACLLPALLWVWWRVRRLEGRIRRRRHEQEEQLSLLLHELIEELELRGNALLDQIERREERLRALLDQAKLMEMYAKTQSAAAEEPGAFQNPKHVNRESAPVAAASEALPAANHAATDPTIRRQIQEMLRQGLSAQSIAQRLQVGVGEVEVARNLDSWREGQTNFRTDALQNEKN